MNGGFVSFLNINPNTRNFINENSDISDFITNEKL